MMFPRLHSPDDDVALEFDGDTLSYTELAGAAAAVGAGIGSARQVAVWATPTIETAVAVVGALTAGVPVVPLNPRIGERELAHVLGDSEPDLVLAAPGTALPTSLARLDVDVTSRDG